MLKKKFLNLFVFILSLTSFFTTSHAAKIQQSINGYWLYGFEQSILKTCDNKLYWMWVPDHFTGTYKTEGYANPVRVNGFLFPADPVNNMNSPLPTFKVSKIKYLDTPCNVNVTTLPYPN